MSQFRPFDGRATGLVLRVIRMRAEDDDVELAVSRVVGGVDKYLVDGLVNTIAAFIVRLMSPLFRAAQTGFTQNYALVMVLGLMLAVAAFFARDIALALRNMFAAFM